jgi:hypothetical protein
MRLMQPSLFVIALTTALSLAPGPRALAGEEGAPAASTLGATDPCGYFRGQAYGRGLDHFLTEMVWACETIARRRAAGMPLGDRLLAVEGALERYRTAVVAAGAAGAERLARASAQATGARRPAEWEAVKASIAAETGTLAALEAIRSGF